MPVKIVTDSAADLTAQQVADHDIRVVPLKIRFGDEEFVDGVDLTTEAFYEKMAASEVMPATAAPAPGQFEEAMRDAGRDGDQVVCINISSGLSATMQSAQNAARAIGSDLDVRVVDSRSITGALGMKVLTAATLAADGATADQIVAELEALVPRTRIFGALNTLENLKKNGRIGGAQAMLGSLLSIKPIVDISTGEVTEAAKQRTRGKSLVWLRDRLFQEPDVGQVAVCQGMADDYQELVDLLAPRYSAEQISLWTIGPVIASHGGPAILGLCWHNPT
jgi:DegV family protein with EDD domain